MLGGAVDGRLAHVAVKFSYPADFRVVRERPGVVYLEHVPPTGLVLWMEKHLHIGQAKDWEDSDFYVKYEADSEDIGQIEADWKKYAGALAPACTIRRAEDRLGPALVLETQGGGLRIYNRTLFSKRSRLTTAPLLISTGCWASRPLRPELHRTVDEMGASLEIVSR